MDTTGSTPQHSRSRISDFLGILIPVGCMLLFIVGIPLGYKLVLGGNTRPLAKGLIEEIAFRAGVSTEPERYRGKRVKVLSYYLVVARDDGSEAWLPRETVSILTLRPE